MYFTTSIGELIISQQRVEHYDRCVVRSGDRTFAGHVSLMKNENPEAFHLLPTENGERLWEGDMILTKDQIDSIHSPIDTRKAIPDPQYWWPNGEVPYIISKSSEPDRKNILSALKHWSDNTCLRFSEINESPRQPHVIFVKGNTCESAIGRQWEKAGQDISISPGCGDVGTIIHEVGHAIGFHHEQLRSDRDQHVKILLENVKQGMEHNFDKIDTNNFNIPYDLGSVMHYGLFEFSVTNEQTIIPFDINQIYKTGNVEELSFKDIKLANLMYNCDATCTWKPACLNEGFVDQHCRCRCDEGYNGTLCERFVGVPDTCGGRIQQPTTIRFPDYPVGRKCKWIIKDPKGRHIVIDFRHFDLHERTGPSNSCEIDSLKITDGAFSETYCGRELKGHFHSVYSNELKLEFEPNSRKHRGFVAKVHFI